MSSSHTDHYSTLGISRNASKDDVRKAYKKLARAWHPDKHPSLKDNAERKFKEIAEAHRVLSDSHLRYDYDKAKDNEKTERERELARRKRENIRRMAREQEDYVRRQEVKRRKAQRMRAGYGTEAEDDDVNFENPERSFKDFFEDRETWRNSVPDLFSTENNSLNRMMSDIMKMSSRMSLGSSGFTSQDFRFTDSSSLNQTFDSFFSQDPFSKLKI